jgi:hypothetical protein
MAGTSATSLVDKMQFLQIHGTRACQPADIGFPINNDWNKRDPLLDETQYCAKTWSKLFKEICTGTVCNLDEFDQFYV